MIWTPCTVVLKEKCWVLKQFISAVKMRILTWGDYGDWVTFGVRPKWSFEDLKVLILRLHSRHQAEVTIAANTDKAQLQTSLLRPPEGSEPIGVGGFCRTDGSR